MFARVTENYAQRNTTKARIVRDMKTKYGKEGDNQSVAAHLHRLREEYLLYLLRVALAPARQSHLQTTDAQHDGTKTSNAITNKHNM